MNPRSLALVLVTLVALVGCAPQVTSATPPGSTPTPLLPTPTPLLPTPTAVDHDVTACSPDQVGLTTGEIGGAAGTTYIVIRASLANGDPCRIVKWPSVVIADATGASVAEGAANPAHAGETIDLSQFVDFNLGWSSWCLAPLDHPLTARIGLLEDGSSLPVALPDAYEPSGCLGVESTLRIEPAS